MNSNIIFFFFSAVFSFKGAAVSAFNITAVLATRPSFSTFNDFLTRTGVADAINSRPPPVTVLAVDNVNISSAALPPEVLKRIVSVHVLLRYYDAETLRSLGNTSVTVTTLFQASGEAANNLGSINITGLGSGNVGFRSVADSGGGAAAPAAASLVAPVVAQLYNFSVLQISNVIVPPGIDNNSTNTNSSSAPAPSPITPPSPSPLTPPSSSPTNPPASPTTPPFASPTKPPATSPTEPPAASPIKPPAASPSPRKMISPSPGPSKAPSTSPESAPTPTAPAADDESSSNSVGVCTVASTILSLNLFLVFFV